MTICKSKWPKVSQVAQGGSRWLKVAQGGSRRLKVAQGGSRWLKVAQGGSRWLKVAQGGLRWLKVAQGGSKWLKVAHVAQSGSRGLKLDQFGGSGGSCKVAQGRSRYVARSNKIYDDVMIINRMINNTTPIVRHLYVTCFTI